MPSLAKISSTSQQLTPRLNGILHFLSEKKGERKARKHTATSTKALIFVVEVSLKHSRVSTAGSEEVLLPRKLIQKFDLTFDVA